MSRSGQCPGDLPERHHHHITVVQGGSLSEPAPRRDSILNSPLEYRHDTAEGRKVRAAHRRTSDSLGSLSANRIHPFPMVIQLPSRSSDARSSCGSGKIMGRFRRVMSYTYPTSKYRRRITVRLREVSNSPGSQLRGCGQRRTDRAPALAYVSVAWCRRPGSS